MDVQFLYDLNIIWTCGVGFSGCGVYVHGHRRPPASGYWRQPCLPWVVTTHVSTQLPQLPTNTLATPGFAHRSVILDASLEN